MQYKMMVLGLLQERPKMHDQLCEHRLLLSTMEHLASELKASHEVWKDRLARERPGCQSQIASEPWRSP